MSPAELVHANLTSPAVLAFVVGAVATFAKADLRMPDGLYLAITTYLLLAIGIKGGAELSASSPAAVWLPALVAIAIGLAIPLWSFAIARKLGGLRIEDAAALAAHYGSVSVVTFTACVTFLDAIDVSVEGFMPALLAMLEAPAIIVALVLARRSLGDGGNWSEVVREVVAGRSVILLVGGIAIGVLAGKDGIAPAAPLFVAPFYGVLVIFLLEMGRVAAEHMGALRQSGRFLIAFGVAMPALHGALGVAAGTLTGLSIGGATALGALCASASYIAAPAAVRIALPRANPGLYLTASLGITFPFNLAIGIPLYYQLARVMA